MNPSGPGALVEPRLERTLKISCSVGMALRASFSSRETELSKRLRRSSEVGGNRGREQVLEVVHKQLPMAGLSEIQDPEKSRVDQQHCAS